MDNEKVIALLEQQNRILSHVGLFLSRIFVVACVIVLMQIIQVLIQLL